MGLRREKKGGVEEEEEEEEKVKIERGLEIRKIKIRGIQTSKN